MIHQYKLNGYNIVLDVFSGAVHSVDDLAYDIIAMFEGSTEDEIVETMLGKYAYDTEIDRSEILDCIADVRELKESGQLFTEDEYERHACDFKNKSCAVKALCLHVAHTCNLSCEYCFAAQGKYHGERAIMSFETGKQALEFLIANSGNQHYLEVDFFGGEPLMNWDVVKQLVAYARSREAETGKRFRFTLTTNGVLVDDDVIEFANREMNNVVMSLDGRPEIHDALRKTPNGKGSYDIIVPKFQKFAKARGDREYYVRGTYTHRNVEFTEDIFHMADLGFTELSMEPVVCAPDDPYALTEDDLPILFEQYEILAEEMIKRKKEGRGFTFYHYMIDLESGPCIYKRISGCGSGTEYLAVTPWGELYPCHQFVGDPKYSMGNVWDGVINIGLRDKFKRCNAYARPDCAECWAKLYCSGGCAANAYHATGDITGTYEYGCELFRKRMECAIMIKVAESEE
ncbi:MAG: thioether cross-link-forming SCIFF peptide maturase [Clostridiales bacterium]|nr:thioether cross-link-forming SCIFF peptide maturase [Clostridiales bacterium]